MVAAIATLATTSAQAARAHPSSSSPPPWWLHQAGCIHAHESVDWHARLDWRGRPSRDHGGMQIDVGTWAAYAPRGFPADPAAATVDQQLAVAWRVYLANGSRWGGGQWPRSSKACGLR